MVLKIKQTNNNNNNLVLELMTSGGCQSLILTSEYGTFFNSNCDIHTRHRVNLELVVAGW